MITINESTRRTGLRRGRRITESMDVRELERSIDSIRKMSSKPMAAIVDGGSPAALTLTGVDVRGGKILCDVLVADVRGGKVTTRVSRDRAYNVSALRKIILGAADFNKELRKIVDRDVELAIEITSALGL